MGRMGVGGPSRGSTACAPMLARVARSRAPLLAARSIRPLCTAPEAGALEVQIEDAIALAKQVIEKPVAGSVYPPAEYSKDLENGSIDLSRLGKLFPEDESFKKEMVGLAARSNETVQAIKAMKEPTIDWAGYNAKFTAMGLPTVVAELKADFEASQPAFIKEVEKARDVLLAQYDEEYKKTVHGPNGILADLDRIAKDEAANKVKILEELQEMLYETQNIETMTISEILEKNPEWRIAIEEDIKNHNWSPEVPESLKAKAKGGDVAAIA